MVWLQIIAMSLPTLCILLHIVMSNSFVATSDTALLVMTVCFLVFFTAKKNQTIFLKLHNTVLYPQVYHYNYV